jgi:PAS domain S-box-containing protein
MVGSRSRETASIPRGLTEAILGTVSDAIIATDADGLISFWNPGAARIFGFTAEEAVGRSLDLIIPENLRARHWMGYNRVMATGESRYGHGDLLSVPGLTKDGRRISVEFTIVLLHDGERKPVGIAAILRDVTKRFEEARELKRQLANSKKV